MPTFIFFPNRPPSTTFFGKYHPNEIEDKQKNKLKKESYFFMFRKLEKNTTCLFIGSTFKYNSRLIFDSK